MHTRKALWIPPLLTHTHTHSLTRISSHNRDGVAHSNRRCAISIAVSYRWHQWLLWKRGASGRWQPRPGSGSAQQPPARAHAALGGPLCKRHEVALPRAPGVRLHVLAYQKIVEWVRRYQRMRTCVSHGLSQVYVPHNFKGVTERVGDRLVRNVDLRWEPCNHRADLRVLCSA